MDPISSPSGTMPSTPAEEACFSVVVYGRARRREDLENTAAFLATDLNVSLEFVLPCLRKAGSMPMIVYTGKSKADACSIARRIQDLGTPCYVVEGETPFGTRVPLDDGELPVGKLHSLFNLLRRLWN